MTDKHMLTDMQILEISLVDEPANPQAHVEIFKRKESDPMAYGPDNPAPVPVVAGAVLAALNEFAPQIIAKAMAGGISADPNAAELAASILQETAMDMDAITKALADAEAKLADLEKGITAKDGQIETLTKALAAKDEEIAKAKKKSKMDANQNGEPDGDEDEEEVMKSLPEAIRKRLADAEADRVELAKAREKEELSTAVAKAKGMGVAEPEKVGAMLLRIAKGKTNADDAQILEGILKGAAAIGATAAIFKSIGTAAVAEINDDPEAFLKAKAEEISKAKGIPYAAAYVEAMDQNPQAYNTYLAKRRVAN